MEKLKEAIKRTVDYAKRYGVELSGEQIWFRLLSGKTYSQKNIRDGINKIKIKPKTTLDKKVNQQKLFIATEFCQNYLTRIPTIQMVGITGSVAAESARRNEDIDLLIVCKQRTLWITRLIIWILVRLKQIPHRKYGKAEGENEFCFNLWLEEKFLQLPREKQTQKNAVDLILMKILLERNQTYQKFIKENKWAGKYVANGYKKVLSMKYQVPSTKSEINKLITLLNEVAYWLQIGYIRMKGPINFIDKHRAFFHQSEKR